MTKIIVSQICKIFNGSCSLKDFVRDDQFIMKCQKCQKVIYVCSEAFCSKFLIHYCSPLSTDVCHRKKVPLGRRDKKKKKKTYKNEFKGVSLLSALHNKMFSYYLLSLKRAFPHLSCYIYIYIIYIYIMLVSFF